MDTELKSINITMMQDLEWLVSLYYIANFSKSINWHGNNNVCFHNNVPLQLDLLWQLILNFPFFLAITKVRLNLQLNAKTPTMATYCSNWNNLVVYTYIIRVAWQERQEHDYINTIGMNMNIEYIASPRPRLFFPKNVTCDVRWEM